MKLYVVLLCLWLVPSSAGAHAVSNSYLDLSTTPQGVMGSWRIAVRDLDGAISLDSDADGHITDAELAERAAATQSYLGARLELEAGGQLCPLTVSAPSMASAHVTVALSGDCRAAPISVRYDLFFDHDSSHQGHLNVGGASQLSHIFTNQARYVTIEPGAPAWHSALLQYLGQGIWHILIGVDHILFLLTLLIAAVLRFERGKYEPVTSFRGALLGMAKIVTAFTAAHSITLSAMGLGFVALPSRWVETAIALSIVAAAANNLRPLVPRRTWVLGFAFGLIHGLGFAGVLLELGLPKERVIVALLGFNLGVEVGQLGIVSVCFPPAFWLRTRAGYSRWGLTFGSAMVGVIGLTWSLERALAADWTARLWRSAHTNVAAALTDAELRACDELPALSEPGLYDAVMKTKDEDAVSLAERRAFELACAGQFEASARIYAQALGSAGATPVPTLARIQRGYAEVEQARGDVRHAEKLLTQAVETWRSQPPTPLLGDTLARLGELMARDGRWADAYLHYDEARRLHEASGDTPLLAKDLSRLADALVSAADAAGAKELYEKSRAAYEQVNDVSGVATQYRNLAIVARLEGDTTLAAQMYRRAIELHERHDHRPEAASDMAALARVYLGTQQYGEAKALYERALEIERQLDRKRFISKNYNQLGNLHQLQGELGAAEHMYREALRASEQAGDLVEAANNCANLAGVYQKQGQVEQARGMYERSLSLFGRSGAEAKVLRVRGLLASLERGRRAD